MTKIDDYRQTLRKLDDWIPFLLEESCLPGPRGNLELAHAVAREGNKLRFEQLLYNEAQENTPEVFLVFCGLVGLGRLAASEPELFDRIRPYATDPRWRVREAIATGLQLAGDQDMDLLLREMKKWSKGNWFEKRAAAAALAEPRLLKNPRHVKQILQVFDEITVSMEKVPDAGEESFRVMRQAMAFCWSVVVAALPEAGKPIFEKWLNNPNRDIRWIMKENLKKNRLIKRDPGWVEACHRKMDPGK